VIIVFGILAVSTASIFIRFAQSEVSSLVIAAYRLGIAALLLAPVALLKFRNELGGLSRSELGLGVLSGVFLAVHFASWITSLEYTSVVSSVVLVTTTPIWVALLSPFTIKENISREIIIGLSLALAGTLVIAFGDSCLVQGVVDCPPFVKFAGGSAFLGDFLALVGAWCAAGYVLIGRGIRNRLSLVPYIFVVYGIAAVILIGMVFVSGQEFLGFAPMSYFWLILLALVPQLIGHSTINWALGLLPAAYVAVTLLGEPVGTSILAAIFLDEIPGIVQILGAILIFVGILIASKIDIIIKTQEDNLL
jgi:drug/metabolite transporter (DMT)-like permease